MIRLLRKEDKKLLIEMMTVFYHSEAVSTDGSPEIFQNDFDACVSDSPFLEGYIFEEHGEIQGYAMLAKSFSTEFGKPCIWVEDLYLRPEYRGKRIGAEFFKYIEEKYPGVIFRLEVERENTPAYRLYSRSGYREMPYCEMLKEPGKTENNWLFRHHCG